jgi:hypothetical protein
VQSYRYFVSHSSEFCHRNPLCCFSVSNTKGKYIFCYGLSPETFGYTLVFVAEEVVWASTIISIFMWFIMWQNHSRVHQWQLMCFDRSIAEDSTGHMQAVDAFWIPWKCSTICIYWKLNYKELKIKKNVYCHVEWCILRLLKKEIAFMYGG